MPDKDVRLTQEERDLVLDLASQLRLAATNGENMRCGKADVNLSTGMASFTCRLPVDAFRALYFFIDAAREQRHLRR